MSTNQLIESLLKEGLKDNSALEAFSIDANYLLEKKSIFQKIYNKLEAKNNIGDNNVKINIIDYNTVIFETILNSKKIGKPNDWRLSVTKSYQEVKDWAKSLKGVKIDKVLDLYDSVSIKVEIKTKFQILSK